MAFTEHASKKYVDERDALLATKNALAAEAQERERLANIVSENRRETYTKDEVNRIVEALRGARFVKVERLPELADADMLAIYLVPRTSPETDNRYDEYIVVTDGEGARSWDKLGSTDIDLSGYATKAEVQVVRESVGALSESVDELQESITSESSRISTLENKVDNPSQVPTEDSDELISSGGVYAALQNKADKETDERFMRTKADIYLSARKGNDANDGLAPERAVKTIARAYAAAKAAVDAQTLDGTKQVVVAVDEGVYGSVQIINELTAGIAFRAVGARDSTFVVPSNDPGDEANQTPMSCDNGVYPHVFEMEGFTFTGFNGRHHTDMNPNSHQRGIVYGMTLRRCLITGNRPICTKAFVCGTFIDCDITGNATRLTPQNVGGDAPFGGYGAVYNDLAYMTRMFNCHVWDNDFSTFQYFAKKIEAAHCLFENSFAFVSGVGDSYGGHNNTMIAERYTNPYFAYSDTRSKFYKIGVKYFAVIASSADSTTDPFYTETADYVCVQSAQLTDDKIAADASCPSVRSDGSLDFGYRDSGFGRKKTADALTNGKQDALTFDATPTEGSTNPVTSAGIREALAEKADKSDVDPLLFGQYYPEGNVKSAAEFTSGIKYNSPDMGHRTITVKPFCNTGTAANDNSDLVGRVVIPPFVDAQGNGYISDDGTRYKVVGVSNGDIMSSINTNLTAIITPNTVTSIGHGAFVFCYSLVSVSLPAVERFGVSVFNVCKALTSVSLPTVATIDAYAFESCDALTSISLPAATSIGDGEFFNCIKLTSVDFGDTPRPSVPSLGTEVFYGVPTSCMIIVPDAQYDAWTAARGWSDLVTAGYTFLRHSGWEYARKYEVEKMAAGKLDAESAFPAFSEASTYAVGYVVTHEGGLYICRTAVETAGPWDAGDWEATTLDDLLSDMVPLVVVDDEITIANIIAGTRVQGSDANFADRWPVCVPLAWCYGYVLKDGQAAQGIRLNNGYVGAPDGVGLVVESATQVPYSAELVRTFTAPVTGSYDVELTIAAPDVSYNLPRYYDVLVDDATVPSLAYRGSTLNQGEVRITHPGSIALEKGEHRLRIRAVLDRYNAIMAVRGLRIAKVGGYFALNNVLLSEAMPSVPTQNELAEAVKKLFTALGGTIQ